ncbi:11785_t:CDS:2 [Acaulospora colombiana]|uniref:11785_t:CDS:1 n=1 Tax=Acaulospora colombiana TaxID=27376 RepID=A0ACA9KCU5_9GLOM|nr:11785_t:CDS:2 [Acaulospora colombiana]
MSFIGVPRFNVDLDSPPEERYRHILLSTAAPDTSFSGLNINPYSHFPTYIACILASRDEILLQLSEFNWIQTFIVNKITSFFGFFAYIGFLSNHRELKGIVKIVNKAVHDKNKQMRGHYPQTDIEGITLGWLALMQYIYEASAMCTSIIIQPNNDTGITTRHKKKYQCLGPLHIRTMDWAMPFLRPLTVELVYHRNKKPLYIATTWIGYLGVLTGMRLVPREDGEESFLGAYSVSVNYRSCLGTSNSTYFQKFIRQAIFRRAYATGTLVRHVMEHNSVYSDAVNALSKMPIIAPCYFIVAGSEYNQGTIITRGRDCDKDYKKSIDSVYLWELEKQGTICQTNMDHWTVKQIVRRSANNRESNSGLPEDIFDSVSRVCYVEKALPKLMQKHVDSSSLWRFISAKELVDKDITIYGTLMCPLTGEYETRLPFMKRGRFCFSLP